MRIDATSSAALVQQSQDLSTQQTHILQQLSSGVRISALSDDPLAAATSSTLTAALAQQDSFLTSATTATSRATAADSALAAVVSQLTSALSLVVQGANNTQTPAQQQSIASQLAAVRDSVLNLANSSYSGSYLFAGSASTTTPYTLNADGSTTYNGDAQTASIRSPNGASIPTSLSGSGVFGSGTSSVFAALQTAITQLQSGSSTGTANVAALRSSLDGVTVQRSSLDANLNRLNTETTYVTTQQTNTKVQQSGLLAADTVSLATQLSAVENQQTALLSTLSKINKTSLFDYL